MRAKCEWTDPIAEWHSAPSDRSSGRRVAIEPAEADVGSKVRCTADATGRLVHRMQGRDARRREAGLSLHVVQPVSP